VPGINSRLKCRGQVIASTKTVTYEVTVKELGYGLSSVNLVLFIAPKNLPVDVAKALVDAFAAANADPAITALLEDRSLNAFTETGAALEKSIIGQSEAFKQLLEAAK